MEIEIDGRRISKVWTQSYRTKMASAVYEKITKDVMNYWKAQIEKDNERARKKLKKGMNECIKSISKTLTKEFKKVDSEALRYFLESQYNIGEGGYAVENKLNELGIPTNHWHSDTDTPKRCTELLDSKIEILHDIGFVLLEFLRTGHRNEWVDVCDVVRAYKDRLIKENKYV